MLLLWLVEDMTYAEVGKEFGVSKQAVGVQIQKAIEERSEAFQQEIAVNVRKEFGEQLRFAKKLRRAAEEYLSSETDPMRLILLPRADEIEVVYYDFEDKTTKGEPKKKTATLHALLAKVEASNIEADKVNIKHVDMRKFALDAISVTDTCIDKFAKLGGEYMKEKPNPADPLVIARKVVDDAVAAGMDKSEAVQKASERYGVLEEELIGV